MRFHHSAVALRSIATLMLRSNCSVLVTNLPGTTQFLKVQSMKAKVSLSVEKGYEQV